MNNDLISVKNLSVKLGNAEILKDVSFTIKEKDFIGIIGPNGGGKSTLIKALLKIVPHSGDITYSPSLMDDGHRSIGYMPQISTTDRSFPISVIDTVLSGLQSSKGLWGRYTACDMDKAKLLLDMCGIKSLYNSNITNLSGGEFQRVMLCRAIISDPLLLILDEPNNFVDNKFEGELYGILKELNKKMAVVIVSHDIGTISSHIKSIICVNKTVHYHDSNVITPEQLNNYNCPIQLISHGDIPHTVLKHH